MENNDEVFTTSIVYEVEDALNVHVWLEGELLNEEPQLIVHFRRLEIDKDKKYYPIMSFENVSDGVDFESLNEVMKYCESYKKKLEALHK